MTELAYLVAYDVADDARRVAVAELLLDLGASRLQRSVFWLVADDAGLIRMRSQLRRRIDEDVDRVHWYRMCGNCRGVIGQTRAASVPRLTRDPGPWIV